MAKSKKKKSYDTKKSRTSSVLDSNNEADTSRSRSGITSGGRDFNPEVETPHELPEDYETDSRP